MKKIKYVKGDATKPKGKGTKVIPHICNDIGKWGRGFVVALSKRWKSPEKDYKKWYKEKEDMFGEDFALGKVQFVHIPKKDIFVANIIGQHTIWKGKDGSPPIRYDAVRTGLKTVADLCLSLKASVHAPKFGAGLAGGDWEKIEEIINEELCSKNIEVTIYLYD